MGFPWRGALAYTSEFEKQDSDNDNTMETLALIKVTIKKKISGVIWGSYQLKTQCESLYSLLLCNIQETPHNQNERAENEVCLTK